MARKRQDEGALHPTNVQLTTRGNINVCRIRTHTCRLDRTSSTELTEAIDSKYQWYRNLLGHYVHLCDVLSLALRCRRDRWVQ